MIEVQVARLGQAMAGSSSDFVQKRCQMDRGEQQMFWNLAAPIADGEAQPAAKVEGGGFASPPLWQGQCLLMGFGKLECGAAELQHKQSRASAWSSAPSSVLVSTASRQEKTVTVGGSFLVALVIVQFRRSFRMTLMRGDAWDFKSPCLVV